MIANGTNSEAPPLEAITNNGFWPDIDPNDFRAAERVDTGITARRTIEALRVAMIDVNRQLASFQADQQNAGIESHAAIAAEPWQIQGCAEMLYVRAVYAQAHADLLERYRDYSATGAGKDRGEASDLAADDYRGDARWAVSELIGQNHTTVELI